MKKLLCILLSIMLLFASCGGDPVTTSSAEPVPEVKIEDIGSYTLVISKTETLGERDMVIVLKEAIEDSLNVTLKISMDTKESEGKEILLGNTNREASKVSLKYSDYVVKQVGENIVIGGGSKTALKNAVDLFIDVFVMGKEGTPKAEYLNTFEYTHENSTVGGVKLTDFAVVGTNEEDEVLKVMLGNATGVEPKTEGANQVVFEIDETLEAMQARCGYKDGNIVVYSNGKGISKKQAALILGEFFASVSSGSLTVDLTKEMSPEGFATLTTSDIAEYRSATEKRISDIKNTPNMTIPKNATVYYFSNNGSDTNNGKSPEQAWESLERLSDINLNPGDYVLFERGGYFRGSFSTKTGVTYSAYGVGEKPIICASPEDGADPKKWTNVGGNVWVYETPFNKDVGTLVFNHGEAYSVKWLVYQNADGVLQEFKTKVFWDGPQTMKNDLDMWHNNAGYADTDYKVYVYSEENPGKRFSSIEFLIRNNAVGCGGDNVTIDNLTIKYTGAHGIGGGTKKNLTIQNCTFEWIGGSLQYVTSNVSNTPLDRPTRYGNAVEIYGGCDGFVIENCYFNQVYDAAVTHQYNGADSPDSMNDYGHYNVVFKNNVMDYCTYSIEYFLGNVPSGNTSHIDNVLYEGNHMWYCGQGFGSQRPLEYQAAHIKGWGHQNPVKNFVIKDNLLAISEEMFVDTNYINKLSDGEQGIKFENNTLIGEYGQRFGMYGYRVSTEMAYGSALTEYLKEHGEENKFYIVK